MSSIYDIAGTTSDSFSLNGKCTLLQGSDIPSNYQGQDGDIYFRDNGYLYTKSGGQWNQVNATSLPSAKESENKFLYSNGETYQASERSIDEIVYVDELQNVDNNAIHKTGDEEINGVKTFNDKIYAPNQIDYSRITNCITEIPQDIKLDLTNGVLTLKAGSKVYAPNGVGVFDEIKITNDLIASYTFSTVGQTFLYYNTQGNYLFVEHPSYNIGSGNIGTSDGIYYYTESNYIVRRAGGANSFTTSFPLAKITVTSDNIITSIDQVFNGFGYIGSTIFALPGVKGLIPNGRNEDGSLKNIEFTSSSVKTTQVNNATTCISFNSTGMFPVAGYYESETAPSEIYSIWYKHSENFIYDTRGDGNSTRASAIVPCFISTDSSGKITSFNPKTTFKAVDYKELEDNFVHKTGDEEITLTKGNFNTRVVQQDDGNFVIYKDGQAVISTQGGILQAPNNQHATANNSVLTCTGINKSGHGFIKMGNGIIIQWGQSGTGTDITLPTPFASTNYKVVSTGSGYNKYGPGYSYNYTTTTFRLGGDNGNRPWIAIGY